MRLAQSLAAAAAFLALSFPALAHDGVHINDAYARIMPGANAGAIFMEIENHQMEDDRLVKAISRDAEKVELHTHKEDASGVMQMMEVPEGFVIPGNGSHALARGGDHIMLMGLTRALKDGDVISVTLTFERAGEVTLDVPVDNARKGMGGMGMGMKHMEHGAQPSN